MTQGLYRANGLCTQCRTHINFTDLCKDDIYLLVNHYHGHEAGHAFEGEVKISPMPKEIRKAA